MAAYVKIDLLVLLCRSGTYPYVNVSVFLSKLSVKMVKFGTQLSARANVHPSIPVLKGKVGLRRVVLADVCRQNVHKGRVGTRILVRASAVSKLVAHIPNSGVRRAVPVRVLNNLPALKINFGAHQVALVSALK